MASSSDTLELNDLILIVSVSGVTTLNVFLSGALTVALPTIGKDLHFTQSNLQWPLNVYALSYGCFLLFFGRVSDIIGGKIMFLVGSIWFSLWSLATAFAPTSGAFIGFVAAMGLGAAANTPSGLGLFAAFFPPGAKRNKAYGVLGAGQPLGFILGLILGGILAQSKATWRAVFFIQSGLGVLFVVLGFLFLVKQSSPQRYTKGVDWVGAFLSAAGIGILTYSLGDSTTAQKGWSTPQIPSLFAASIVILIVLVFYERRREGRGQSVLLPIKIWRQPGTKMTSVMAIQFFVWWSFNTLSYFMTLYYQQVNQLEPLQTALRFVPMTAAGVCVNVITGYVMSRVPGQPLLLVGILASIAYCSLDICRHECQRVVLGNSLPCHAIYWFAIFNQVSELYADLPYQVGADVVYPVGNLHLATVFDEDSQSLAGGLFNVASRMGTSLGLAVSSSVATATSQRFQRAHPELAIDSPEVLMAGFRAAGWTCFAVAVLCFGFGLFGLRGIGIVGQTASPALDLAVETRPKEPKPYHPLSVHIIGPLMAFSAFGLLARLGLSALATYNGQSIFPLAYVQATGCLIMGFCLALKEPFNRWYPPAYVALTTGFCGSMTTFSDWQLDIFESWLNANNAPWSALYNVLDGTCKAVFTISLSLASLFFGMHIANLVTPFFRAAPPPGKFFRMAVTILSVCTYAAVFPAYFLLPRDYRHQATAALLFSFPGTFTRYLLSTQLDTVIPSFPLGTFAANSLGTALLGTFHVLQTTANHPLSAASCTLIQGLADGFCGCLTTVSTFAAELVTLKTAGQKYRYALTTWGTGQVALVFIFGAMLWGRDIVKQQTCLFD
ncbi:MFS general substrate transporter [Mycena sanguinolenta]|uniref:MFS general substrate transporter n=1 Tax=Mycena sanguinolenta TaxID=230812 RepID=A0A8H6XBW5_9AGAR|nr:MFS general substrate transporter [Mycena sanguinolenta]